jgi:hypothetical protein
VTNGETSSWTLTGSYTDLFSYGLFNDALCTSVLPRVRDEWVMNCMKVEEGCRGPYRDGCLGGGGGGLRKLTKNSSQHNRCRGTDKSNHCHFSQFDEESETSVYARLHYSGICRGTVW